MALIRTKENYDYSTFSDQALSHDGCIVDCGCYGLDMFASLVGKKRIIGIDPLESEAEGYEIFEGVLGAYNGVIDFYIERDKDASGMMEGNGTLKTVEMLNWKSFCLNYDIGKVSILKLNIEGSEYPLLNSMDTDDFEKIDQIMVSFHDWINPKWRHLTFATIQLLLANGFERRHIASQYGWNLFVKQ